MNRPIQFSSYFAKGLAAALILAGLATSSFALDSGDQVMPGDPKLIETCMRAVEEEQRTDEFSTRSLRECIGQIALACQNESDDNLSTLGMANCARRETLYWDQRLNADYRTLQQNLSAENFASLRDAQRAWLAFRDAECGFQYQFWIEGSIRNIFHSSCMLQMTGARALDLMNVLDWMDF